MYVSVLLLPAALAAGSLSPHDAVPLDTRAACGQVNTIFNASDIQKRHEQWHLRKQRGLADM